MKATASIVAEICSNPAAGINPPHSGNRQKAIGFRRVAKTLMSRTR